MTAGKIAAIAIATTLGVGGISALGVSEYNRREYGRFTPYISAEDKKCFNEALKLGKNLICKASDLEGNFTPEQAKKIEKLIRKITVCKMEIEQAKDWGLKKRVIKLENKLQMLQQNACMELVNIALESNEIK